MAHLAKVTHSLLVFRICMLTVGSVERIIVVDPNYARKKPCHPDLAHLGSGQHARRNTRSNTVRMTFSDLEANTPLSKGDEQIKNISLSNAFEEKNRSETEHTTQETPRGVLVDSPAAFAFSEDTNVGRVGDVIALNDEEMIEIRGGLLPSSCTTVEAPTQDGKALPTTNNTLYTSPKSSSPKLDENFKFPPLESPHAESSFPAIPQHITYAKTPLREPSAPTRAHRHHERTSSLQTMIVQPTETKPSIPLHARRKTNDGLLGFRANPVRSDRRDSPNRTINHRRKMSLGIPVNVRSTFPAIPSLTSTPTSSDSFKTPEPEPCSFERKEKELEYKHHHTFIGTASLNDFLENLDVSLVRNTTTKAKVIKAYTTLAAAEQLQARQQSLDGEGWELVARIDAMRIQTDYVSLQQIKLGHISLCQFLDLLRFDESECVDVVSVAEAFCAASHLDMKAGADNGSKAKAFRSWVVRHCAQE
jgi:hypothetical protein